MKWTRECVREVERLKKRDEELQKNTECDPNTHKKGNPDMAVWEGWKKGCSF